MIMFIEFNLKNTPNCTTIIKTVCSLKKSTVFWNLRPCSYVENILDLKVCTMKQN